MAKRLSAMFSSSKDKDSTNDGHSRSSSRDQLHDEMSYSSETIPPIGKLSKSKPISKSPSLADFRDTAVSDLPLLPPITGSGIRPTSQHGRPYNRAISPSTRGSSGSRPQTPDTLEVPGMPSPVSASSPGSSKVSKRKSWIPGRGDKKSLDSTSEFSNKAWIAGLREHVSYDLTPLLRGERVTEIWDEDGDVTVYLFPESSAKGPSFKVSSSMFADSLSLNYLCRPPIEDPHNQRLIGNFQQPNLESLMGDLSLQDKIVQGLGQPFTQKRKPPNFSTPMITPRTAPIPQDKILRLPLELDKAYYTIDSMPQGDDMELIVLYRNFFSFLAGGALISTSRQNSLYAIFMGISSILNRLQYGNEKGSSWGAIPWTSFSRYTEELKLADVRSSRERNIEAIIIGEAMKSWPLYNEGFAHAVGRLDDVKSIKSPKFNRISPITMNRLERANLDLQQRLTNVHTKLDNFDFPSMFSGIANSQTSTEARLVRFKAWKQAFLDFRSYIIAHLKRRYGAWPPKASSKKNNFEESGLNRRLLREIYQDFTDLYDMLVDRGQLTTRSADMPTLAEDAVGSNETIQHAIRVIESEYDRSTPPVLPPIPFDVPLIPEYANSFDREHVMLKKDPAASKKLKDSEMSALLLGSYNRESIKPTQFCQDFLEYERKLGGGKSVQDLVDNRCGQWLFVYAVLQSLPMLVVDARDLKFTDNVEYFLCMAPRGGRPWMKEDTSTSRAWYNVASGGGLISLPADMIDHSVEGIYRRSHCYVVGSTWAETSLVDEAHTLYPKKFGLGAEQMAQPFAEQYGHQQTQKGLSPYAVPSHTGSSHTSPYLSPLVRPLSPHEDEPGLLSLPSVRPRPSSTNIGLQEIDGPMPELQRPNSTFNPNITFDNILGAGQQQNGKKTKKKK